MQLRSGRRLASPVPAPRCDLRRVRPRRIQEEDRISNLPEDMRLEVLARLSCVREAMRTSVLSGPWRGLWTQLRDLTFDNATDLDSLVGALAQVRPKLDRLCIDATCNPGPLPGERISELLRAADKLEPSELVVNLRREHRSAAFELPCFGRAISIILHVQRLRFTLPLAGDFGSLEQLSLTGASHTDPGALLPRCPRLRRLRMDGSCLRGAETVTVESSSLEELAWQLIDTTRGPVDVHVVAPNLIKFELYSCSKKLTVSLSAPELEELDLHHCYTDGYPVGYGEKWLLTGIKLQTRMERSSSSSRNRKRQHVLLLTIQNTTPILPVERSFEQEVAGLRVTSFSALELNLRSMGHVFGALVFHLLRIRTTIKRLRVVLLEDSVVKCSENCDCDAASNWRNEHISLPYLEVAEFEFFRRHDHEMDFLKLLFGSAPRLKTMTVRHFNKISLVKEACQKLHSIFPANSPVKFSFS